MRTYTFRNSGGSYRGIPIVAANMDTVGTFEMALVLNQVEFIPQTCATITVILDQVIVCNQNKQLCFTSDYLPRQELLEVPPKKVFLIVVSLFPLLVHSLHHHSQALLCG